VSTKPQSGEPVGPKRVVVLGASGGVGRQVVEQALGRDHEVIAVVRTPGKLAVSDSKLSVVTAELSNRGAIDAAVRGADAVISALGPSLDRRATGMPLVQGTRNIVDAMEAARVQRYVGMATPSLGDPRDRRSLLGTVVPLMGRLLLPRAYRELLAMSQIVTESDLDWTIARFTRPTDGPAKATVRAGFLGRDRLGSAITRADIATFLLDQLGDTRFIRAAPAISN
jgi:putative NADH-flavin reductase